MKTLQRSRALAINVKPTAFKLRNVQAPLIELARCTIETEYLVQSLVARFEHRWGIVQILSKQYPAQYDL